MNILAGSELRSALARALDSTLEKYRWDSETVEQIALNILTDFVERLGDELS